MKEGEGERGRAREGEDKRERGKGRMREMKGGKEGVRKERKRGNE